MEIFSDIRDELNADWLPAIYRDKVRTQRTRAHRLEVAERENETEIYHTLLGVELKVRNKRILCPDLSTARYLQVFARIGCQEIAIPYDITKISHLADELESSWHKILLIFDTATEGKSPQVKGKQRAHLTKEIRRELGEIGAGTLMPEFKQSTKQRP